MSAKADLVLVDSDLELPRWYVWQLHAKLVHLCTFLNNDDSLLHKYMEFSSF